ncbi:unnamed protein product [Gongylonema pulchrum]|uniref:PPM-type phosphatase domain-containing protein n=1 Tax=Gongylonema pulchrum TaxID=637853 RepID=A0A183EBD9_9BILA|nr:unnamed protein product [Gongylonema pulchrum]
MSVVGVDFNDPTNGRYEVLDKSKQFCHSTAGKLTPNSELFGSLRADYNWFGFADGLGRETALRSDCGDPAVAVEFDADNKPFVKYLAQTTSRRAKHVT